MSTEWLPILIAVVVAVGFGLGAYSIARTPSFYVQLGTELWPIIKGVVVAYFVPRNTPKVEEKMHQATRRAQEWDNFNKRPRDK